MNITIRHESSLYKLSRLQHAFLPLSFAKISSIKYRSWIWHEGSYYNRLKTSSRRRTFVRPEDNPNQKEDQPSNSTEKDIQIVHATFIGKSGYGKSSLINAIIGNDVMGTSAVEACTKQPQSACFSIHRNILLSLADTPGVGECTTNDAEYLKMYGALVGASDATIYVLRADSRDYTIDLEIFEKLFPKYAARSRVIIALNACDKIEPLNRQQRAGPSAEQLVQVRQKQNTLRTLFPGVHEIIPCCASPAWNLEHLTRSIASLLLSAPGITVR